MASTIEDAMHSIDDSRKQLQDAVAAARSAGISWKLIDEAIGVSRQAAQQRFGNLNTEAGSPLASAHPQANLVHALECLMFESWDDMPENADKTGVRLHYITTILRHFDVTPKPSCGYRPDKPPFTNG